MKQDRSETQRVEVEVITSQIASLNEGIHRLDRQLGVSGEQLEGQKNLNSIKGIGVRGAAILLAVIGDVADFEDEHKLESLLDSAERE